MSKTKTEPRQRHATETRNGIGDNIGGPPCAGFLPLSDRLNALSQTLAEADSIAERVVTALKGSEPEPPCAESPAPKSPPLVERLAEVQELANAILRRVRRALEVTGE